MGMAFFGGVLRLLFAKREMSFLIASCSSFSAIVGQYGFCNRTKQGPDVPWQTSGGVGDSSVERNVVWAWDCLASFALTLAVWRVLPFGKGPKHVSTCLPVNSREDITAASCAAAGAYARKALRALAWLPRAPVRRHDHRRFGGGGR